MLKKALFVDENRSQIEPRTRFLQFYIKTKKVCKCLANLSSEQAHFTHGMRITALIRPSHVKKSNRSCSIRNYAKVCRRSRAFAIVVTSRSSSFEYTMLVHTVHAGSETHPGSGSDRTTASVRQVTALAMLYIGRLVTCDIDYSFTP